MKFVKPPARPRPNILLVGRYKTGKSIGAGTAPGGVLFLNADLPNATRQVHLRNPDGRIMEPEMPLYEEGRLGMMELMAEIAHQVNDPNQKIIDSVVVDPVGELYRRMLEDQSRRAVRPSLPQYGDVGTHLERFCRMLCVAPVTTVLVAHELATKDEVTGEFVRIPFTGTKAGSEVLGAKLAQMVDIVAHTGVVERDDGSKEYLAQLFPAKGRDAGDRFACLGDVRPLDIAEWIACIEEFERTGKAPQAPETVEAQSNGAAPESELEPEPAKA
jgi:hypothetical protein